MKTITMETGMKNAISIFKKAGLGEIRKIAVLEASGSSGKYDNLLFSIEYCKAWGDNYYSIELSVYADGYYDFH